MMPRLQYAVTDAPATGKALRFLVFIMLLWIAGRMIANGLLSAPAPDTPLQQMLDRTAIGAVVKGPDRGPYRGLILAEPKRGFPGANISPAAPAKISGTDAVAFAMGATSFAAAKPADILVAHQLMLWNRRNIDFASTGLTGQSLLPDNVRDGLLMRGFAPGSGKRQILEKPIANHDPWVVDSWAVDSWAFVRGGGLALPGQQNIGGQTQYGGSQAGAIARYYPWAKRGAPSFFLRATRALSGPAQREIAIGALVRPAKNIPVQLAIEQRVAVDSGGSNKPAAYIISDIAPPTLPSNIRANIYAQAGIVGVKNSAYFFDLQMTLDTPLVQDGRREIALGAGLWSGGQGAVRQNKDGGIASVKRVDIGPRLSAQLPVAGQQTQFALDWRQRVAGNADPGSGPALTVSTRF